MQKNILRSFKAQVYVILINRVVYKEPIKSIKKVIYTILNVTLMKFFHLCKCLSYLIFSFLAIHCERKQSQCLLSDGLCKTAKSKHQQISITNVNLSLSEPYFCVHNVGFFMKYILEVIKYIFQLYQSVLCLILTGVRSCICSPFQCCTPILDWSE